MKQLDRMILIEREPSEVFALISDPVRAREFFVGITLWEPRSEETRGEGARFKILMRVGSIEAGGVVRITQWRDDELITWESESGIEQRGGWRLEPSALGTALHLHTEFRLVGPLSGLVEWMTGRIVGRNMTATLLAVRRLCEFESRTAMSKARRG